MEYNIREKLEWTVIFILEFGRKYGLTMKQAFNYLSRYKGIDFIDRHWICAYTVVCLNGGRHRGILPSAGRGIGMKLYHGTNRDFDRIDLMKSKPNKDFGRGFYLSTDYDWIWRK